MVTNTQLCLMVGVPMLSNAIVTGLFWRAMVRGFDKRFGECGFEQGFKGIDARFDEVMDFWRAELRGFEERIVARLKRLEERR